MCGTAGACTHMHTYTHTLSHSHIHRQTHIHYSVYVVFLSLSKITLWRKYLMKNSKWKCVSLRNSVIGEHTFVFSSAFVFGAWETSFLLFWKSNGILSDIFLKLPTFTFSWNVSFKVLFSSVKRFSSII